MPDTELRSENCQGRTEHKHGKSAPLGEKQKWGRTYTGTNLKKEMKLEQWPCLRRGPTARVGYPPVLCTVFLLLFRGIGNTCTLSKNMSSYKIKVQEKRNEVNNTSSGYLGRATVMMLVKHTAGIWHCRGGG